MKTNYYIAEHGIDGSMRGLFEYFPCYNCGEGLVEFFLEAQKKSKSVISGNMKKWKKLSSKVVYKNPWLTVREDKVVRPDGKLGTYSHVDRRNSVFVVAVNSRKEVYLIGQHRYVTDMYSLEFPGGGIDHDTPLRAAKRELLEETGFQAKRWKKLGFIQINNGISPEIGHVFLAQELSATKENNMAEEGIDKLMAISVLQMLSLVQKGKISDGTTLASIMLALPFLQ